MAGSCGDSVFNFSRTLHAAAAPFYLPISYAQGFSFLHILTLLVISLSF